jgi:phosphate transport system substrate-binding protein
MKNIAKKISATTGAMALALFSFSPLLHAAPADLPEYEATSGISGTLNAVGSDTMVNLMALWADGFESLYPNVTIQTQGAGSSTAPPALIEGTAQMGPMSRAMKQEEIDHFQSKFGYSPTRIRVAIDALAVFVHKDNPIEGMTLQELDSVYSSTLKRGGQNITTWGGLGLPGDWANRPISLYGRNSASGTYGFFKDVALDGGDFKNRVKEQPGSSSVVQGIASDLYAIGYSGIGYQTSGVKALPIGYEPGNAAAPTLDNCLTGDYPLARFLYIYVNKKPNQPLDKTTLEFIKYVLSRQGQTAVSRDGYYPVPEVVATEEITNLSK